MQERRNSIANALELRLSCTDTSMHCLYPCHYVLYRDVEFIVCIWEKTTISFPNVLVVDIASIYCGPFY